MGACGRIGFVCIVSLLFLGCSTPGSTTPGLPASPKRQPSVAPEQQRQSMVELRAGTYQYLVEDSSVIVLNNDTSIKQLPFKTSAIYTLSLIPKDDLFSLSVKVESLTVNTQLQTVKTIHDSLVSLSFSALVSKQGVILQLVGHQLSICTGGIDGTASRILEISVVHPPIPVTIGSKWADTLTATICHGRTTLLQHNTRSYQVLAFATWHNRAALQIQRIVATTITEIAADSTHHILANGSGTGSSSILIDQESGALLESIGESELTLTVTTSRGVFPFKQDATTHIELR
jgi:hypothetical protein